jgi:hypothetical protein
MSSQIWLPSSPRRWSCPHAQAKKVLANIFQAPRHVVVGQSVITVRLAPAANRTERDAIANLFAHCNRLKLTLPGDLAMRPLRFQAQNI